jgi:hypothetical protein
MHPLDAEDESTLVGLGSFAGPAPDDVPGAAARELGGNRDESIRQAHHIAEVGVARGLEREHDGVKEHSVG